MRLWLFLHLIGGAIWLGGMITMGALVPTMRRSGVTREQIQSLARQFGRVSWVGFALAVASGAFMWWELRVGLGRSSTFVLKVSLVVVAGLMAFFHQGMREMSARRRGLMQGLILIVSLGIFAAGAAL